MGRKAKYSKELKVEIVKKYLKGESASILANEYGLSKGMRRHILEWANQYKALGEKVFEEKSTNKAYTKEFKEQVIKKYLEQGEEGLNDKRGRPSSKQEKENLSEVEKLQIEIESLKARNIRLERTIVALKKKEEIEARMKKDFQKYAKNLRTKQSKN